jgi:hypothetical protein
MKISHKLFCKLQPKPHRSNPNSHRNPTKHKANLRNPPNKHNNLQQPMLTPNVVVQNFSAHNNTKTEHPPSTQNKSTIQIESS